MWCRGLGRAIPTHARTRMYTAREHGAHRSPTIAAHTHQCMHNSNRRTSHHTRRSLVTGHAITGGLPGQTRRPAVGCWCVSHHINATIGTIAMVVGAARGGGGGPAPTQLTAPQPRGVNGPVNRTISPVPPHPHTYDGAVCVWRARSAGVCGDGTPTLWSHHCPVYAGRGLSCHRAVNPPIPTTNEATPCELDI